MKNKIERGASCPGTLWHDEIEGSRIFVWRPDGFSDESVLLPVIYALDGQMLLEHPLEFSTIGPKRFWNLDRIISNLIAEGCIPPVMLVGVWNTGATRHEDYIPWTHERSRCFASFVTERLIPFAEQQYGAAARREDRAMFGSSLGGLMSLYFLGEYSTVFSTFAALSVHDPWLEGNVSGLAPVNARLWLDTGTREYQSPRKYIQVAQDLFGSEYDDRLGSLYSYTCTARRIAAALKAAGWRSGTDLFYREEKDGEHNEAFWEGRVANAVLLFKGQDVPGKPERIELDCACVRDRDCSIHYMMQAVVLWSSSLKTSLTDEAAWTLKGAGSISTDGRLLPEGDGPWTVGASYRGLEAVIELELTGLEQRKADLPPI